MKQTKSSFVAKLGEAGRKAHEMHKGDDTKTTVYSDLPGGINNGIAQLVECKFVQIKEGKQNAGEWMFYAAGVVKAPTMHDNVPIEGLRTSISEPLFDTPTRKRATLQDHIDHVYQVLRTLGLDTSKLKFDDLENAAAALKESAPHFRFTTWKPPKQTTGQYAGKESQVTHKWGEVVSYDGESDSGVTEEPAAEGEAGEATDEFGDLDSLAEKVDAEVEDGDEDAEKVRDDAIEELWMLAEKSGITKKEFEKMSGADTVERIRGGSTEETEVEAEVEEESTDPQKEQVYGYKPLVKNAKTGKTGPASKPVDCEVTAVDTKGKTVVLKNLADNKVYKNVKWESLIPK
jgi:SHS2 domain-containing protein